MAVCEMIRDLERDLKQGSRRDLTNIAINGKYKILIYKDEVCNAQPLGQPDGSDDKHQESLIKNISSNVYTSR